MNKVYGELLGQRAVSVFRKTYCVITSFILCTLTNRISQLVHYEIRTTQYVSRRVTGALVALLLALLLALAPPVAAQEAPPHRAGLVVVHGDGRVRTRCVSFEEPEISGLALLQRSGLAVTPGSDAMGATVCSLDGEGCPANDCFCECKGQPCRYWIYYHQGDDGAWRYSGVGASAWMVGHGDVDAWIWGGEGALPPAISWDSICDAPAVSGAPATPIPPATPAPPTTAPTSTSAPTVIPTAEPTSTSTPRPTDAPSRTPTPTSTATRSPTLAPATATATPTSTRTPTPTRPSSAGAPPAATTGSGFSGTTVSYLIFLFLLLTLFALWALARGIKQPR